jgi:hypothetical protein
MYHPMHLFTDYADILLEVIDLIDPLGLQVLYQHREMLDGQLILLSFRSELLLQH